jgi:hypothetical protein
MKWVDLGLVNLFRKWRYQNLCKLFPLFLEEYMLILVSDLTLYLLVLLSKTTGTVCAKACLY